MVPFPRRSPHSIYATCVECISTDLKFEPVRHDGVGGAGTIYAYTIMYHTGDKRFAAAVPYASIIVELDDAPTTLVMRFTLPDANAVWAMKRKVTDSVEVAEFWRRVDAIVVSRQRRFLAPYEQK